MNDRLKIAGEAVDITVNMNSDDTAVVRLGDEEHTVERVTRDGDAVSFVLNGTRHTYHALITHSTVQVTDGSTYHSFARIEEGAEAEDDGGNGDDLTSKMPGTVLKLLVEAGAEVSKGTPLLILEAMKMEHEVCAPLDGVVDAMPFAEGERVMPGDLLVVFTES